MFTIRFALYFCLLFGITHDREDFEEFASDYYALGSEQEAFMVIVNLMYLIGSVPAFLMFIATEYEELS